MSIFPITSLVRRVQGLIMEKFIVSEPQAEGIAAGLVALAEGWGSPGAAEKLDWSYRVMKDLGETGKLKWRSEVERANFEAEEKLKYQAWDAFISGRNRS